MFMRLRNFDESLMQFSSNYWVIMLILSQLLHSTQMRHIWIHLLNEKPSNWLTIKYAAHKIGCFFLVSFLVYVFQLRKFWC